MKNMEAQLKKPIPHLFHNRNLDGFLSVLSANRLINTHYILSAFTDIIQPIETIRKYNTIVTGGQDFMGIYVYIL